MNKLVGLIVLCSLVGCSPSLDHLQTKTVLCDQNRNAWFARPHLGDTSFVSREPEMDSLCQKWSLK